MFQTLFNYPRVLAHHREGPAADSHADFPQKATARTDD
jgi:hypothetical protein